MITQLYSEIVFNKQDTKEKLLSLVSKLEEHESSFKEVPIEIKRAINCLLSLVQAIDRGLYIDKVVAESAKRYLVAYDDFYTALNAQLDEEQEEQLGYSDIISKFNKDLSEVENAEELEGFYKRTLKKDFRRIRSQIQGELPNKSDSFKVITQSVIPLVERRLYPKKFAQLGIDVFEFEQYFIFKNQTLLAINTDLIRDTNKDLPKKKQRTSFDIAQSILNETYNTMTILYEDPVRIKECPGFVFYWVMPTQLVDRVVKQIGVINGWGLNL